MSGNFAGEGSRWTNIKQVPDLNGTLLMIEDYDPRNYLMNSWYIQRRGKYQWVDYVAGNHDAGDNMLFADGHQEYREWQDPDTLSIYSPWRGFGLSDPGSIDLDYLGVRFKAPSWRQWYPDYWR